MEADWEVEIGSEAPAIEALWPGFVDLRSAPERIDLIEEAAGFAEFANALLMLNGPSLGPREWADGHPLLPVWTSKCDLWPVDALDGDEMDAAPDEALVGLACYIDMLPRDQLVFESLPIAERWARNAIHRLKSLDHGQSRVDLVIRQALAARLHGFGITAYITVCGPDDSAAHAMLGIVLRAFAETISAA